ncbi:hypothetical protein NC653_012438 [Populus alba x Populus x berolinensis]|uniref:Uncharacterized protein n=1 Tax=Populus alba x Populus x berolinensis TaxID=444605 RepID=A0AAD6W974_9ROSI|nr:hypothetical protein NC653_012438 [Populus alba x Populus x berolinensis]
MQPLIFDLLGLEDNFDSKYLGILNFKIQNGHQVSGGAMF